MRVTMCAGRGSDFAFHEQPGVVGYQVNVALDQASPVGDGESGDEQVGRHDGDAMVPPQLEP